MRLAFLALFGIICAKEEDASMIGREKEQSILLELAKSDHSELAVVYGRRRVGKTFLVRETCL